MNGPFELLILVGGSFAIGEYGGDWIADALHVDAAHLWTRRGIKIGLGLASWMLIAAVLP